MDAIETMKQQEHLVLIGCIESMLTDLIIETPNSKIVKRSLSMAKILLDIIDDYERGLNELAVRKMECLERCLECGDPFERYMRERPVV